VALPYRKVVLIEGDPYLSLPVFTKIKTEWFPRGITSADWVVIDPPSNKKEDSDYIASITEELSLTLFMETNKVVVVHGFPDRKEIREGFIKIIPFIPEPNTLILCDDLDGKGVMKGSDWNALRNTIEGHGFCIKFAPCLDAKVKVEGKRDEDVYNESEKIHYITQGFQTKGYSISVTDASLLLSLLGANRAAIDTESQKLMALADGAKKNKVIDEELILSSVMPISFEYPQWQFSNAFNSGSYANIMFAADALLKTGRYNYEFIMGLALKQTRWQLIAVTCLLKEQEVYSSLRRFGSMRAAETAQKNIWPRLNYRLREQFMAKCRRDAEKKKSIAQEVFFNEPSIRNVVEFVQDKLLRSCPFTVDNAHGWAYGRAIERYLVAHNALVRLRACKNDAAAAIFTQNMRSLSL
jgi:hypothetical protein